MNRKIPFCFFFTLVFLLVPGLLGLFFPLTVVALSLVVLGTLLFYFLVRARVYCLYFFAARLIPDLFQQSHLKKASPEKKQTQFLIPDYDVVELEVGGLRNGPGERLSSPSALRGNRSVLKASFSSYQELICLLFFSWMSLPFLMIAHRTTLSAARVSLICFLMPFWKSQHAEHLPSSSPAQEPILQKFERINRIIGELATQTGPKQRCVAFLVAMNHELGELGDRSLAW